MNNPWNLTDGQARALDAVVRCGGTKQAASELGLSVKTIENHVWQARSRSRARTTLRMYIEWDRERRDA